MTAPNGTRRWALLLTAFVVVAGALVWVVSAIGASNGRLSAEEATNIRQDRVNSRQDRQMEQFIELVREMKEDLGFIRGWMEAEEKKK